MAKRSDLSLNIFYILSIVQIIRVREEQELNVILTHGQLQAMKALKWDSFRFGRYFNILITAIFRRRFCLLGFYNHFS